MNFGSAVVKDLGQAPKFRFLIVIGISNCHISYDF